MNPISPNEVNNYILSSQVDILTYLGTAIPLALTALVALIAAGWGIYLLVKYTGLQDKMLGSDMSDFNRKADDLKDWFSAMSATARSNAKRQGFPYRDY